MKKIKNILISGFVALFVVSFAQAQTPNEEKFKTFRSVAPVTIPEIKVPTIVEVSLPSDFSFRRGVAVFNKSAGMFEPSLSVSTVSKIVPKTIDTSYHDGLLPSTLVDGMYDTYQDFDLPKEGNGKVVITYTYEKPVRSNSLYFALDRYVALPNSITVKAEKDGAERMILSEFRPYSNTVVFPENVSNRWIVEFNYSQPLRISELEIQNLDNIEVTNALRFLAKPGNTYELYLDPEVFVNINTSEAPNLNNNVGIKKISTPSIFANKYYQEADSDNDGISDIKDNCVDVSNFDQEDVDKNGRGDACDDFDRDGIINSFDNCVNDPNYDQIDTDNDSLGDYCDDEESRITEKYPWLVWGGIIFSALVFLGLFALVISRVPKNTNTPSV